MELSKGFRLGDWKVFPARCCLELEEEAIRIEPKLMSLLTLLASRSGEVVSKEEILETIWSDAHVAASGLSRNLSQLRKILKDDSRSPRYIETISKRGYRLMAKVEPITSDGDVNEAQHSPETSPEKKRYLKSYMTAALVFVLAFALGWFRPGAQDPIEPVSVEPPLEKPALVVLPFVNGDSDPETDYFVDGLTEDVITILARVESMDVVARTSSYALQGLDIHEIATRLKVNKVLEGSVRTTGLNLQISVRLVDAKSGFQIWGETYERRREDVFFVQDEIVRMVLERLAVGVSEDNNLAFPTVGLKAYDNYLLGQYWCHKGVIRDFPKAIDYFEAATSEAPNYARAWSAKARSWALLSIAGGGGMEAVEKARRDAEMALEIDPTQDEAHATLGLLALWDDPNGLEGEIALQRAIALNDRNPLNHMWYSIYLNALGRHDEAMSEMRFTLGLDPLNVYIMANAVGVFLDAGRIEDANIMFEKAIALNSEFPILQILGIRLKEALGQKEEALAAYKEADPKGSIFGMDRVRILADLDRHDEAGVLMRRLRIGTPFREARAWLALGETEKALSALERAWQVRDPEFVLAWRNYPELATLHLEPRWVALMGPPPK